MSGRSVIMTIPTVEWGTASLLRRDSLDLSSSKQFFSKALQDQGISFFNFAVEGAEKRVKV